MTELLEVSAATRAFYGVEVLRGVDLAVRKGSLTGLIGPNGAGKSTLFNVVSGLYPADGGAIRFKGADVTRAAPDELVRAGLVRSFQLARGFPKLSVFQHLVLHGRDQPGEGLAAALFGSAAARRREQALGEKALAVARRLKLESVLDNLAAALSGGQKKLLEIGRALMAEPEMILLDEPMAGVNPALAREIAAHLRALNAEGVTILLIEHDMGVIRELCDPVIVMAEGRVLTEGGFAAVAADPRVQEAYLGRRR
ncbi:MAG: ABC transporter ATP-binding protein [Methylobacteriaceae bacterium]|nr:ABC transporter ATP-binding protein [Methylobacteriaceae bacterium]